MSNHPVRDPSAEKPERPTSVDERPDDDIEESAQAPQKDAEIKVQPIDRETVEKSIAPDPDPDDPVSP